MELKRCLLLLERSDWAPQDARMLRGLQNWRHFALLRQAVEELRMDALYHSPIHGSGHINRVLLMAGLIAWMEDLTEEDTRQYFRAASYHDVGRYFDGLDLDHGTRSAQQLATLTGVRGERLRELQGAVAAHSQPDARLEDTVAVYRPQDYERALELARLLKDADNLDRVRLGDLNPRYLRHDSAKSLAEFSQRLLDMDQTVKRAML